MDASRRAPRLRATLAVAFISSSVVVLLLYSALETYTRFKIQESVIFSGQQLKAQEAAKMVSDFVHECFSILETAIWLTDIHKKSEEEQKHILQGLLGLRPALRGLVLLDTRGRIQARSSRLSMEASQPFTDRLEDIAPGSDPLWTRKMSLVYIDNTTNEPMVNMAVPVRNVFGDYCGLLVAELNLRSMWDIVDQLVIGETGYVYVADRDGNLLAFHDTARVLKGERVRHLKAVADFIENGSAIRPSTPTMYQGILGSTVVGTFVPLKTPDWAVVTELPWEEAYREVIKDIVTAAGTTLAMAILAGFFGLFVAKRLAAPVINLTEISSRIAAGETDLQATMEGPREIVHLAVAFNSMTTQLRRSLVDLERRLDEVKRTEKALRLSEERLRLALEGTADGIWDWNLQTDQVYFSPRYYTMMGYEPDEFPAGYENWRGLIHPADVDLAEKAVQSAIEKHSSFAVEFRFKGKNGQWQWILSRGKVTEVDAAGRAIRVAGSHTDITKRRRAEEALRKYERIVSTSRDLMAMISREYVFEAVNDGIDEAQGRGGGTNGAPDPRGESLPGEYPAPVRPGALGRIRRLPGLVRACGPWPQDDGGKLLSHDRRSGKSGGSRHELPGHHHDQQARRAAETVPEDRVPGDPRQRCRS